MKIVRLTSDSQTASFDNTFNDDITISEKSRVALHSLTTETSPSVIDLNASNNQINFQPQTGSVYTATIAPAIYNKTNKQTLFNSISDQMNDQLDGQADPSVATQVPTGVQIGQQWKCDVGEDKGDIGESGKTFIGYKVNNQANMSVDNTSNTWISAQVTEAGSSTGGNTNTYARTPTVPSHSESSYCASVIPITQGCGHWSCDLQIFNASTAGPGGLDGLAFGLTKTKPTLTTPQQIANCEFSIECPGAGDLAIVKRLGVVDSVTNQSASQGDRVGIERIKGIWYPVKYASGARSLLSPSSYSALAGATDKVDLYLIVFFIAAATDTRINRVRWTPDPFLYPASKSGGFGVGPQNPGRSSQGFLEMSITLANFLGYQNQRIPSVGTITLQPLVSSFNASTLFKDSLNAESFYVELLSLSLDCYDGLTNGRKSILAVIPVSDSDQKILYEPDFPVFIDINNQYEITLRNIRARLLNQDGSPVLTDGVSVLTLLFDG